MVTRADLPDGLQAAQAAHAAFQFSIAHPGTTVEWLVTSNFLVVVAVPDEDALLALGHVSRERGILTQIVREPDLDNAVTAVVLEPGEAARRLCSALPLALRERAMT